ncbi:MAG: CsiV family protein, partial [Sinobacterium sp.]
SEKFKQSRVEEPASNALDLLTPYLKPDLSYLRAGLPYCRASNRLKVQTQYEQDFAFPLPKVKKNESYSPQTDDQSKQTPQNKQVLTVDPDNIAEEYFQFQDATTDKFVKLYETLSLAQTTDNEDVKSAGIKSTAKSILIRPSIQVEFIEWQMPSEFLCAYAEQIDPSFASIVWLQNEVSSTSPMNKIKRVPKIINGNEWQRNRGPFLLPTSTMYMTELYEKIKKQRDISPILHINWRQEVKFGREDAQTFRLFAGENLAEKFDANALPMMNDTDSLFNTLNQPAKELYIPEQELAGLTPEQQEVLLSINGTAPEAVSEDLFAKISSALIDDTPINFLKTEWLTEQQSTKTAPSILKELWRLDGGITVYLRNVGRVPYLHIDSNLDIRQPIYDPNKTQKTEELSANLLGQDAVVINPLQQPNFLQRVNFNQ